MSRSNPTDNAPHPCARWIEWDGSNGEFRYYDKEQKKNVSLSDNLTFILLDQVATIKGWHKASDSGIFSNEVRDIKQDVLVVQSFKGGPLAEGPYKQIRDTIIARGGHFTSNLYVAIKIDAELAIASIQFKGAALSVWMEFSKINRGELYKKAIRCKDFVESKRGKIGTKDEITIRTPVFHLADVTPETDAKALDCDRQLQEFLKSYFGRTRVEQVATPPADAPAQQNGEQSRPRHFDEQDQQDSNRTAFDDLEEIPFAPIGRGIGGHAI